MDGCLLLDGLLSAAVEAPAVPFHDVHIGIRRRMQRPITKGYGGSYLERICRKTDLSVANQ